jgi:hypothetical protein
MWQNLLAERFNLKWRPGFRYRRRAMALFCEQLAWHVAAENQSGYLGLFVLVVDYVDRAPAENRCASPRTTG